MYRRNNLTLLEPNRAGDRTKYLVRTPDKRILEEFTFEKDAILFMQETLDFLTPAGRKRRCG